MKYILVLIYGLVLVAFTTLHLFAQASDSTMTLDKPDLNVKPQPLSATPFVFPKYREFTMSNGLHVFVVEDHSLPRITFSMIIKSGEAYSPQGKEGTAAFVAEMLLKGTKKRSAKQIAEQLDGVGASISASTVGEQTTIVGASLKKRADLLFEVLAEALIEPSFPEEEYRKLRDQFAASIASKQARSSELASALSRKVVYGQGHPLARYETVAALNNIQLQDVKDFYSTWYKPNIASIAIVGDVTEAEVKKLLEKHLKHWKKSETPTVTIPPLSPEPAGVYFIARKGSVQSAVVVCAPGPSVTANDWDAVNVMSAFIGSGFGSLLFQSLRETYSYTYSPFAFVTRGNRFNRIAMGAEVRTSVTDSTIQVIMKEVGQLAQHGPDPGELQKRIATEVGSYRLSFEKSSNVAAYLQSAWLFDMPVSWVAEWADRMQGVGPGQVTDAARKYLNPFAMRIVVVGDPLVKEQLEKFGTVIEYTTDMVPVTANEYEKAGITLGELIEQHKNALGGTALNALNTVHLKGTAEMMYQGQVMRGTVEKKYMNPGKEQSKLDLGIMKQVQWINGSTAWISLNDGSVTEVDNDEKKRMLAEATPFPALGWSERGYTAEILGKKDARIVVKVQTQNGKVERYFFDEKSKHLVRVEKEEDTPQGPITIVEKYLDYTPVNGVQFPQRYVMESPVYTITLSYVVTVNEPMTADDFEPARKN